MPNKIPLQTFILLSFVFLLYAFSFKYSAKEIFHRSTLQNKSVPAKNEAHKANYKNEWEQFVYSNYQCLNDSSLSYEAFYNGLKGYYALKKQNKIKKEGILTIVDFTQHSSRKRMYIIRC